MRKNSFNIENIKDEILGKRYELSFSFISKGKIKELNKNYRGKNEPTDILSFPLTKDSGEILICKEMAKKKLETVWKENFKKLPDYLLFLTIHGILHLKGLDHGNKMESLEQKYFKKFSK
jgi:probable rRNA maturation factor